MKNHLQIILRIIFTLILITVAQCGNAADLVEIYQQALSYDPIIQKARATQLANGEQLPQQVAALLPSVTATGNVTWNRNLTLLVVPPAFSPPGLSTYPSKSYLVTFTQPLFNLTNWFLTCQAKSVVKQANATYISASQDLIVRVVRAYLQVLNSMDNLHYTQEQRDAYAKQVEFAKKRFKLGVDIVTSIYNAEASYNAAVSQVIAAENTLRNNLVALKLLTGRQYTHLAGLKGELPLLPPMPGNVNQWVDAAAQTNWDLMSARYAVSSARELVKSNMSNNLPNASLVATTGSFYGQSTGFVDFNLNTVAVQVNVPIFQGGLVLSQTRQAQDQLAAAYAEMKNQYEQATTNAQERFNDVTSGIRNIQSDRLAVSSAQKSFASTEAAYKVGTRTFFDILTAQGDIYSAERQLSNDEYSYLLNTILLKQASGNLTAVDVSYINNLLV